MECFNQSHNNGKSAYLRSKIWDFRTMIKNISPIFLRPIQKDIWNELYKRLSLNRNEIKNAIVSGGPGVGKTRSVTYLLQTLLTNNQLVMYQATKVYYVYCYLFYPLPKSSSSQLPN
eukprot:m.28733 g.28733  ORF g.28733 m.28733 type:complete len:117 (-) comp6084_c0_seq1:1260-1610(-)